MTNINHRTIISHLDRVLITKGVRAKTGYCFEKIEQASRTRAVRLACGVHPRLGGSYPA